MLVTVNVRTYNKIYRAKIMSRESKGANRCSLCVEVLWCRDFCVSEFDFLGNY